MAGRKTDEERIAELEARIEQLQARVRTREERRRGSGHWWSGVLLSVQPRIRLTRSFDERSHSYLGYALRIQGTIDDGEEREFLVGIGKAAQAKHQFQCGLKASGAAHPMKARAVEVVEFYKASKLHVDEEAVPSEESPPPWHGLPPELEVYRERGHRRLATRTYNTKCATCIWGCKMAVEIILDQWNPDLRRTREETFCYGPKSCALYRPGPERVVPGRKGMTWTEEDWVDEDATAHRGPDE